MDTNSTFQPIRFEEAFILNRFEMEQDYGQQNRIENGFEGQAVLDNSDGVHNLQQETVPFFDWDWEWNFALEDQQTIDIPASAEFLNIETNSWQTAGIGNFNVEHYYGDEASCFGANNRSTLAFGTTLDDGLGYHDQQPVNARMGTNYDLSAALNPRDGVERVHDDDGATNLEP